MPSATIAMPTTKLTATPIAGRPLPTSPGTAGSLTATPDRKLDWVRHCPLFSHIGPGPLSCVAALTTARNLAAGEVLFERGTPADGFYIVVFGSMALVLTDPQGGRNQGEEKLVELIDAGESFGQAAMFLEMPLPVTARAVTETLLLQVPRAPVFELLEQDTTLARKMLAGMALRMHRLIHDIEGYAFRSAAGRLADYLLATLPDDGDTTVRLPVTKGVLASKLLVAPETLSRVLKSWAANGWISMQGRSITIHDAANLRHTARAGHRGGSAV